MVLIQDDEPSAATAALEAAYPEINKKTKNKKKGGQAAAAAPAVVEAGMRLCFLGCVALSYTECLPC